MEPHRRLDARLGRMPRRIVILRALMLGDLLCSVPAFRALRHAYPDAEITYIGLPWSREFAQRFATYFDAFVEFPGYPGLPEREPDLERFPAFVQQLQAERYDVALQMHGSGSYVNSLTMLCAPRIAAGYFVPGEYCPDEETFLAYPEDVPEVRRHLRLMEFLGIASQGEHLELPVYPADRAALAKLAEETGIELDRCVCIHPGARYPSRRWKTDRFAQVADALAREGYSVVITGSQSEQAIGDELVAQMEARGVNLLGRTNLGTLAALIERCRLVISNDTGIAHVAAALRAPSLVIVTSSDAARWAPLDRQRHRLVMRPVDCRPCEHVICPIGFLCAESVSVDEVVDQALAVLAAHGAATMRPTSANSTV